jgi:hypothetical protein
VLAAIPSSTALVPNQNEAPRGSPKSAAEILEGRGHAGRQLVEGMEPDPHPGHGHEQGEIEHDPDPLHGHAGSGVA